MREWTDFPRRTDKVALVGFSPTTRDLAPYNDPSYEVWVVNEEYYYPWVKRFDRLFQMHQRWDFLRKNNMNHANHPLWLQNQTGACLLCKGTGKVTPIQGPDKGKEMVCPDCNGTLVYTPNRPDVPIYMQAEWDDIPGSIMFPMNEAVEFLGRKYFRSGISYMLTMAMMMGFPRIELYGFEMGTDTEYHYQKANFEWLVGVAEGKGFDVYLPDACPLLKGPVYGFEDSRIGYRQNLETRKQVLDGQVVQTKVKTDQLKAEAELLKYLLANPGANITELYTAKSTEYAKSLGLLNFVRGAKTETENLTRMYDKYFTGPTEQEDPLAYNYRIVEENVKVGYAPEA